MYYIQLRLPRQCQEMVYEQQVSFSLQIHEHGVQDTYRTSSTSGITVLRFHHLVLVLEWAIRSCLAGMSSI